MISVTSPLVKGAALTAVGAGIAGLGYMLKNQGFFAEDGPMSIASITKLGLMCGGLALIGGGIMKMGGGF